MYFMSYTYLVTLEPVEATRGYLVRATPLKLFHASDSVRTSFHDLDIPGQVCPWSVCGLRDLCDIDHVCPVGSMDTALAHMFAGILRSRSSFVIKALAKHLTTAANRMFAIDVQVPNYVGLKTI